VTQTLNVAETQRSFVGFAFKKKFGWLCFAFEGEATEQCNYHLVPNFEECS
jgi:hypothetical protein